MNRDLLLFIKDLASIALLAVIGGLFYYGSAPILATLMFIAAALYFLFVVYILVRPLWEKRG